MNRVWWATIFGLLLGALFLAMMQRGCDAGANIDNARINSPSDPFFNTDDPDAAGSGEARNLAPITLDATTPNLGRKKPVTPVEIDTPTYTPEPEGPDATRGKTRTELAEEARRRSEERERRLAEIRRERQERNARSRELTRELAISQDRITEAQAARLREIRLSSPSTAEAQRRFREQLTRRGGRSGSAGGAAGGDNGSAGGESAADGDAGGDSEPGLSDDIADALDDLGVDIPQDALDALNDLGGVPSADPSRPTYGDERTDSIGSGGGTLIDDIMPVARWEAVDNGRSADGRDVSSADLFLGFATRPTVPVISSREEDGLMAPGGGFFSGFVIVPETIESAEPMLLRSTKLDTFVTVGGAAPFFTPGSESDPAMWGELIVAEWATTDFGGFQVIEPDADRFGDERYYLWVGRFTAPAGVEGVSGILGVTWLDLASFASLQADVLVENDPSLWLEAPEEPEPTEPENPENPGDSTDPEAPGDVDPGLVIETATIAPTRLVGGQEGTVSVRLRGPAPAGDATIDLAVSDAAALSAPAQLVIPEGESEGQFTIAALEVAETVSVQVSFTLGDRVINRAVTVAVSGIDVERFTLLPQQTLGGLTVQGTVRLATPAGDEGAVVEITSSSALASPPASVLVPAGARTVRFDIPTSEVSSDASVVITASSGATSRSAELVLKSEVFGDVNRDGVVDSFDLAAILIEMGGSDEDADLNDDGIVDYRDLDVLVDLLESAGVGAQPGTDQPVVARWIPVEITCNGDSGGDLTGHRSADLYLGYRDLPDVIGITSDPVTGLRIEGGGEFYHHPLGNDRPPSGNIGDFVPCALFDSYLTVGETRPLFTPTYGSPAWGSSVGAEWLPSPGESIDAVVDPTLFGDDRSYVRIGRFTVPAGARFVGGFLELVGVRGTMSFDDDVTVYHCSGCWGEFDLNSDGVVSDLDLEIMIELLGQEHDMADLDGDGLVDIDDLRLLIAAIGS